MSGKKGEVDYVILEHPGFGEIKDGSALNFVRFAKSIPEAKKFIREEALSSMSEVDICLDDDFDNYCSKYLICPVSAVIQPIPSVSVKISLKNLQKGK